MSKKISDLNSLEQMLEPIQMGEVGNSLEQELAELERQKIKLAEKFLSSDIQKTEINTSERKLIPLLRLLANNPFNMPETDGDTEKFQHHELKEFLSEYLMLGIPLNRKGRKEEVSVMTALFNSQNEINTDEGRYSEKLKQIGR